MQGLIAARMCIFSNEASALQEAVPSDILGVQIEYPGWAGAAPSSEPGQVREEAAIRDR